jgi:DNA-directed RNA polymerase subunit RPC12/RpoP
MPDGMTYSQSDDNNEVITLPTMTYKCVNCGGGLIFDPDKQAFVCEYCGSAFTEAELTEIATEQAQTAEHGMDGAAPEVDTGTQVVYMCPSCGAQIVTDETTAATYCYYCHNPVVLSGRLSGEWAPDFVLPFAIDRDEAVKRFLDWVKKKRFVPGGFFRKDQIEKLSGVYYPYWIGSFDVRANLVGSADKVRKVRTGDTEITTVENFSIERRADIHFDNYMRTAFSKMERKLADGVHPYVLGDLRPFTSAYLTGFMAEKRDIENNDFAKETRERIEQYAGDMIRRTAEEYTNVHARPKSTIHKRDWKYALLPVWVLTYKGADGVMYYFTMNGQTGTVCGKLPVDRMKLNLTAGGIAAAVAAVLGLVVYFI